MSLCLTAASQPHTPLLHLIDSRLRSTNSCAGKVAYASQEGCADRKRACRNRRNPNRPGKGRGHQAAFLSAQQNSGMSMAAAAVASRNQDDLARASNLHCLKQPWILRRKVLWQAKSRNCTSGKAQIGALPASNFCQNTDKACRQRKAPIMHITFDILPIGGRQF